MKNILILRLYTAIAVCAIIYFFSSCNSSHFYEIMRPFRKISSDEYHKNVLHYNQRISSYNEKKFKSVNASLSDTAFFKYYENHNGSIEGGIRIFHAVIKNTITFILAVTPKDNNKIDSNSFYAYYNKEWKIINKNTATYYINNYSLVLIDGKEKKNQTDNKTTAAWYSNSEFELLYLQNNTDPNKPGLIHPKTSYCYVFIHGYDTTLTSGMKMRGHIPMICLSYFDGKTTTILDDYGLVQQVVGDTTSPSSISATYYHAVFDVGDLCPTNCGDQ